MRKSLPSWERGLKCCICTVTGISVIVAPLVGAWIEIRKFIARYSKTQSLPSWERGLKSTEIHQKSCVIRSLPSWERGLKC